MFLKTTPTPSTQKNPATTQKKKTPKRLLFLYFKSIKVFMTSTTKDKVKKGLLIKVIMEE